MNIEALSMADASARACDVLKELHLIPTTGRILIVARWLKRMHDGGRKSMYRTVAKRLDMTVIGDV